ncbi:hypothetical protein [Corallococcus sp. CA054B]|uniref:hypothetical protein n=1 Tax=Corallococcus sp. CA054B TaxID=2316734 RepID=UPI001315AA67|nr:hypothetical protein [Corallococcus sp. CA054B]
MEPNTIIIDFNEKDPKPERISVRDGTRITFRITVPSGLKLTPTITFLDTDHDVDVVAIEDPDNVITFSKATNTYNQDFTPKINKPQTPSSQKFSRTYLVKLVETVPAGYPLRDKVENRSPIGEPPTSSGKIEVSGGPGTEPPSLV